MPFTDATLPPQFKLDNVYYLDWTDNIDFNSADPNGWDFNYYVTSPENLSADDSMGGPGNCSWQWSFNALDAEGNPTVQGDTFVGPWRTWWRLRCGDTVIAAGPLTGINVKLGDDFLSLAGQTWEAYMGRWQYPFNPNSRDHLADYSYKKAFIGNETSPGATSKDTPPGLAYECYQRDIALIAHDILVAVRDGPTNPDTNVIDNPITNRLFFNYSDLLTPIGQKQNLQFSWGDDSTMDSFINGLGQTGEGFDWWINWKRQFMFGSPYRFGNMQAPNITYFIDKDTAGLISLEYNNNGIIATHVLGKGAGLATASTLARSIGYGEVGSGHGQDVYSRLDISYDYGDVRNRDSLNHKTSKSLSLAVNPIREVPISMDPAKINNFWQIFRKGIAIYITVDTGFNQIDAPYRLKSWSMADTENAGNIKVDWTVERIYSPSIADVANFGNPDI